MTFVSIRDLRVAFDGVPVLHGINLRIGRGEAVGLVGESGCGKSVTWLAALGLLPGKARVTGSVMLERQELIGAPRASVEAVRGARIAMIFQDPSSSLNPVHRIGRQIGESLRLHRGLRGSAARAEAVRLLDMVGIPSARTRIDLYPHEFSGGQCQRVMIAMALAGAPDLLIADEPTTALDATIQAQILDLLSGLRRETGMAMVFISHDLGAVSAVCDRTAVMYAGRIVEYGAVGDVMMKPRHPYTIGMLASTVHGHMRGRDIDAIPGSPPDLRKAIAGCSFAPRCKSATAICQTSSPPIKSFDNGQYAACFQAE